MAPPFTSPRIEDSPKRVRVLFGGKYIIDTKKAKLVWEFQYYPVYYFSRSDLPESYLDVPHATSDGAVVYDIVVGSRGAESAVTSYPESAKTDLAGLLKIRFDSADAWFEEDEQIFVHPKDPYKRVDVLQSSRHVRVEIDGVEVANTHKPRFLFETGLRVRTYIPKTDCSVELFTPSELTTACPYKGVANYYHVKVSSDKTAEDVIWWYRNPNLECAAIQGFVAFYDEKVDVWVDGEKQPRK